MKVCSVNWRMMVDLPDWYGPMRHTFSFRRAAAELAVARRCDAVVVDGASNAADICNEKSIFALLFVLF